MHRTRFWNRVELVLMVQLLVSDRCGLIGVKVAADADPITTGDELQGMVNVADSHLLHVMPRSCAMHVTSLVIKRTSVAP